MDSIPYPIQRPTYRPPIPTPSNSGLTPNLGSAAQPRAQLSNEIEIVDNENGYRSVGKILIHPQQLPPTVMPGQNMAQELFNEPTPHFQPAPNASVPYVSTVVPAVVQAPATHAAAPVNNAVAALFNLRVGGEVEEMEGSYADIIRDGDQLIFVGWAGQRMYMPKPRKSGEIAVQVGDQVHMVIVLPIGFTYGSYQFRVALIEKSQQT